MIIQGDPYGEKDEPLRRPLGVHIEGYERHLVISDYHHRNYVWRDWANGNTEVRQAHDERALRVVERFATDWKPTHIHFLGDWLDFFSGSSFCKTPPDVDEVGDSIQAVRSILRRVRLAHPQAELHYYLGNHEERWEHYIGQRAPALMALSDLTYNHLFRAGGLGIMVHPYRARVPVLSGVLELTHGDKVAQKSGASAHKMLEKGISGVSGHTHRLGMVYRTTRAGTVVWAENGCLADLAPDYVRDPDWQQGFTVIYVDRDNARFHMDQIPIVTTSGNRRRIFYAGQVWEAGAEGGSEDA